MKAKDLQRFRKVLRDFERLLHDLEKSCCIGVSLSQCHLLLELDARGRITIGELAQRMSLDASTLSRTVDRMVYLGLVQRLPHPSDRRASLLNLTTTGREIVASINHMNDDFYTRVFSRIPDDNQLPVVEHFRELVEAMQNQRAAKDSPASCCNPERERGDGE